MASRRTFHWEVDIDTTKVGLERFARALLSTGAQLKRHMVFPPDGSFQLGRGITAFTMVVLPAGSEEEFWKLCKPIGMRAPGQIRVGNRPVEPDGHPGREAPWLER